MLKKERPFKCEQIPRRIITKGFKIKGFSSIISQNIRPVKEMLSSNTDITNDKNASSLIGTQRRALLTKRGDENENILNFTQRLPSRKTHRVELSKLSIR